MRTTKTTDAGLAWALYDEAGPGNEEPNPGEWRRDEPRRTIRVAVEVEFTDRGGQRKVLRGHTLNVGRDSMCVVVRESIPTVQIRMRRAFADGAQWSRANLVHCTGTVGGYKVGMIVTS